MAFDIPVSSSRLRKMNPLAEPGLCRAITIPAVRIGVPSGMRASSLAAYDLSVECDRFNQAITVHMLRRAFGSARLKKFNSGLCKIQNHSGTTARVRLLLQH